MTAAAKRQAPVAKHRRAIVPSLAVLSALMLVAACYVGGPFLTLWRLTRALDRGDTAALGSLVDWDAVRQGLKDDIAEGVIGMPQETLLASNTLPPFGASFVSGIAGAEVDQTVTPQGLLQVTRQLDPPPPGGKPKASLPTVVAAGFMTPTQFDLRLRAPGQDAEEEPLHVRMVFRVGGWQVVRILGAAGFDGSGFFADLSRGSPVKPNIGVQGPWPLLGPGQSPGGARGKASLSGRVTVSVG